MALVAGGMCSCYCRRQGVRARGSSESENCPLLPKCHTTGNFGEGLMEVLLFFFRLGAHALPGCAAGRGQGGGVCACAMGQKKNTKTSIRSSPKFPIHAVGPILADRCALRMRSSVSLLVTYVTS